MYLFSIVQEALELEYNHFRCEAECNEELSGEAQDKYFEVSEEISDILAAHYKGKVTPAQLARAKEIRLCRTLRLGY